MRPAVRTARDLDGVMVGGADGRLYRVCEPPAWRPDRLLARWWAGGPAPRRWLARLLRRALPAPASGVVEFVIGGKRLRARALLCKTPGP